VDPTDNCTGLGAGVRPGLVLLLQAVLCAGLPFQAHYSGMRTRWDGGTLPALALRSYHSPSLQRIFAGFCALWQGESESRPLSQL
jgi:hypothetical protein